MRPEPAPIRIVQEGPDRLDVYETVPIEFTVKSRFMVSENDDGSFSLAQAALLPYSKDYDQNGRPSEWRRRYDLQNWVVFAAFDGEARIGGAVVAWSTGNVDMLDGRDDIACLWDVRVAREHRGRGVGRSLFATAADWARDRGCRQLKIETQDINVAACRFYAALGCVLREVNPAAYPAHMNEIQLIWYLDL